MELYVFCLVCAMILGVLVINGIYCVLYVSYPLPGGLEPCPPLARFRRKRRARPSPRTRFPIRSSPRKGSAEVMIPMSQYSDAVDARLQPVVEMPPPLRSQYQQSTPRKKSSRSSSPRAPTPTRLVPPRSDINQSLVSITPPLARSNTPTRPLSSRTKYGQTEI